ncbi:MAG: hypothetical protein ACYCZ6_08995 [Polaromonas sp.]
MAAGTRLPSVDQALAPEKFNRIVPDPWSATDEPLPDAPEPPR